MNDEIDDNGLLPPPPPPPPVAPRRRVAGLGARGATALVALGLMGGGLAGGYIISQAATTASPSATASATPTPAASAAPGTRPAAPRPPLSKTGTVTAVGTNSITIDGTKYAVTSNSDIDKDGESSLSKLVVGDKVTFSTVASASTPTIDKLHVGNEALNRPACPAPPSSSTGG